jgi:hypothetical protein
MPTYDVTFKVEYDRTVRVDAGDEDVAADLAAETVHREMPPDAQLGEANYYSISVARKDDDA